ncbi:MAG: NAD(P)-dependent alcohol dehydrogenase [Bacteroidetes bacterium]|nr:NAD(P)-dependent alcohol dehydrogenase [Bacteroidota bacterium]
MKAVIHKKYGPPEVAQYVDWKKPQPKANEVLVEIYAATVNRTDSGFRSAEYFISRFWSGLFRPKFPILGCEFAGVVVEVGAEVTSFQMGDRVFGYNDKTFGAHAEFIAIAETDAIATMPDNLGFDQAAALTEGAHYALADIRAAKVQAGHQVMVYGATGAIGSAAVQLLKYFGAHVTAVSNTQNLDLVKNLGADVVIDYQTQDFTKTDQRFEFIFDAVGKNSFAQCKPLLTEKGIYISTELGKYGVNVLLALTTPLWGGKKLLFPLPSINQQDVLFLKKLAELGVFRPVIDRYFQLSQLVEAYTYVQSGQKTGNVIIRVKEEMS